MQSHGVTIRFLFACTVLGLFCALGCGKGRASSAAEKNSDPKAGLVKLDKKGVVWLDNRDPKRRRVLLKAEVVLREGSLEMFCCLKGTKEHESILAVDAKAFTIHTALVAAGAQPGKPVQFQPEYLSASGQQIEVLLQWEDDQGKHERVRAQQWVRNFDTRMPLAHSWVFAGSRLEKDPESGASYYWAEDGDVICVANFSSAMLDLSVQSSQASGELLFEPYTERIPRVGTPVTIYLEPVAKKKADGTKSARPNG